MADVDTDDARAEVWDECLATVVNGIAGARRVHAARMGVDRHARAIVSALSGLESAVPRTQNPYRA